MSKQLFILIFLLSASMYSSAQIMFQKTFGGTGDSWGRAVHQTTDGGYIIAGWTRTFGAGFDDVYLIKTNVQGDILWTKTYGGTGGDYGYSLQQTTDGGYIIAGYTNSFGAGNADVYLIKTDVNGDTLWTKTFGNTGDDVGNSVQQTIDGGYIVVGSTRSTGSIYDDAYLIKTNANGDALWTKTFGGTDSDKGNSVQQTTDGGYIITGFTYSGAGNEDLYLIKADANGDTLWTKTFGGINNDVGNSVQQTADGGYIMGGNTYSFGAGGDDVYLIKTDVNGDTLWTKTFGGPNDDYGYEVKQTTDNGYIITSLTSSFGGGILDAYIIKADSLGNILTAKTYGGIYYDYGESIQQTTDGGYIIVGNTNSFGAGNVNVYLVKTDSLCNSGCNEGGTATIVTSPATQVTSPATIVSSTATIVTSPATIVGSGGTVSTLCATEINEITPDNSFLIYPNPANDIIYINSKYNFTATELILYDASGRAVMEKKLNKDTSFSVKQLNSGIYFYKIKDAKGNEVRGKVVKE